MQRKFPTGWKYAKVIPLLKNSKLSVFERKSYRPVALLSPLSKILEKIIYVQLYNYFARNKILHPRLHGYRKNRSTQTALLEMYDQWVLAANKGHISGAVFLDLSAAFDLVSHDLLQQKLQVYGLQSDFLEWINSYMSNRSQSVWVDHVLSPSLRCDVGVPQGSNLGPLFFLLFANDLPFMLDCDMVQYADDSTMTASCKSVADVNSKLEENCETVVVWMKRNMLKQNPEKTHVLTLGTQQRINQPGNNVVVQMDGIILEESEGRFETILGCFIQSNLKWSRHIREITSKLKKRLVAVGCLKYVLPFSQRKIVAEGLINSVMAYCLPVFGGCTKNDFKDLQVLQNKAARIVCHAPYWASRCKMFDHLDWLTVRQMVKYFTLIAVFRIRSFGEPECFAKVFKSENRNGNIIVQNTRLGLLQNSFRIRGAMDWNELPKQIRESSKIGQFKSKVRSWIKVNVPKFHD